MDYTYEASYPCRVISSFYDNFSKIHKYDLIKKIVLREKVPENSEEEKFLNFFKLFQLFYSISYLSIKKEYISFYKFTFNDVPSKQLTSFIKDFNFDNNYEWVEKAICNLNDFNINEAYTIFLFCTLNLSIKFGYQCVVPVNMKEVTQNIYDKNIRLYFFISYLVENLKRNEINLKKEFINFINENKEYIQNLGIKNLYLYGSINNNEYHSSSDFDLVICYCDNKSFEEIEEIKVKLNKLIGGVFYRRIDITLFEDFISLHNIENTTKII